MRRLLHDVRPAAAAAAVQSRQSCRFRFARRREYRGLRARPEWLAVVLVWARCSLRRQQLGPARHEGQALQMWCLWVSPDTACGGPEGIPNRFRQDRTKLKLSRKQNYHERTETRT